MATLFIDSGPTIESQHGHHLVTFDSGGDEIRLMLTRHALFDLARRAMAATKEASEAGPPAHFRRAYPGRA